MCPTLRRSTLRPASRRRIGLINGLVSAAGIADPLPLARIGARGAAAHDQDQP
jgi:hypothetical protein